LDDRKMGDFDHGWRMYHWTIGFLSGPVMDDWMMDVRVVGMNKRKGPKRTRGKAQTNQGENT